MKVKRSNSAEDIENMLTAHFAEFETVEASEDDEDFEADADEDEDSEDVEDEDEILDDVEDDEDSEESEESEESEDESEDDAEDEDIDEDADEDEDEDEDEDDSEEDEDEDDSEDDEVSEDDLADDEESDADEDEDEDFSDEDEDFSDEDEDEADADEDDFDDIDEVIASGEDIVETLIASGAVAVILPTSSHDFAEVKAAFDSLDAEEVTAGDDEDCDDEEEDDIDEDEVDSDEDSDEDFEADDDEDEDEDEADASEDSDEDEDEDEDEADASEDSDEDFEADDEDEEEDEVDADEDSKQFHPVVDLETIAEASADDVEFSFHEFGGTSWWNVTVAGIPAARITKDHLNEEVHAFFATDDFARNIKSAIASEGLMPVLNGAQAEFYATAYLQSEATEQIRETVEASMKEDVTERLATMRDDFLECVDMSIAGIDKNFWPAIGNPIKASLFEQMEEAGVDADVAMEIIEASFAKGGAAHFQAVVAKAVELMDKSQETRDDLRETIGSAGVINHDGDDGDDEEETVATAGFSQALARNSVHTALTLGDRLSRRGLKGN